MAHTIRIREFSTMPEIATEGWDPNGCSGDDYTAPRAAALYDALGVDPSDDEYALARNADGRWALFGLTVEGHRFAEEWNDPDLGYVGDVAPANREYVARTVVRKDGAWVLPADEILRRSEDQPVAPEFPVRDTREAAILDAKRRWGRRSA